MPNLVRRCDRHLDTRGGPFANNGSVLLLRARSTSRRRLGGYLVGFLATVHGLDGSRRPGARLLACCCTTRRGCRVSIRRHSAGGPAR